MAAGGNLERAKARLENEDDTSIHVVIVNVRGLHYIPDCLHICIST